ncbi:DNA-directed RNA polymerase subunit H [Candidatus Woesearchaeota archaeon B3_Woes]|nr:MAG: DNA-directed RNA polymerase subunit H [Candidatus Woesearchaeota archaeon B3_Woes]
MTKFKIEEHILVPKHSKLNDKEKKNLLEKYNITLKELPRILKKDPAISPLSPKIGDVIKIIRKSPTAGEAIFYRYVVNG